jgi:hypothetical protein
MERGPVTIAACAMAALVCSCSGINAPSQEVKYTTNVAGATPSALLSLQIPYASPCVIDLVAGDIDVADLDSTLTIRNAYAVNVVRVTTGILSQSGLIFRSSSQQGE